MSFSFRLYILDFFASSDNSDQDFDRIVGSLPFDFEPRLTLPLPRPRPAPPSTLPLQNRVAFYFTLIPLHHSTSVLHSQPPFACLFHSICPLLHPLLSHSIFTPRRIGGGGVKRLVLSVRPFVHLSVRCLSTQKLAYLAIYRVKRLLNTTVTLKSKKKCPGVYLIVAKAVQFAASAALYYLTTVHSAILIRSQLEYDRGRAYTDSAHVFILAISHAHHFP